CRIFGAPPSSEERRIATGAAADVGTPGAVGTGTAGVVGAPDADVGATAGAVAAGLLASVGLTAGGAVGADWGVGPQAAPEGATTITRREMTRDMRTTL